MYCRLGTFWSVVLAAAMASGAEFRSYDGAGNNLSHPTWGAAGSQLARMAPNYYVDGASTPAGRSRPGPREISNAIVAQVESILDPRGLSDWVFQWGQFIDHDIDLTPVTDPGESFPIAIPWGDPIFDPLGAGAATMPFVRSQSDPATGDSSANPRQQINAITSYLDASNIYGSDGARAMALRTGVGGMLRCSPGDMLPYNTMGVPNGDGGSPDPEAFYAAGDVRANEQVGLTAVHTLFMREHNRLAAELATSHPDWSDEQLYQQARKYVGAEIQAITYNEFLPALLGPYAPSALGAYDPAIDASILTEFSTALFRVGHTMLSPQLLRIADDGSPAPEGPLPLRDAFFQPANMSTPQEMEHLLKGLASQTQQAVDVHLVDDVRNFLFGEPIAGGFDLAALNIQRGRDHGLPDYNTVREAFGLSPVVSFDEITSDAALAMDLEATYGDVDHLDVWVGALAEDHLFGASVGPLVAAALTEQFVRLRDGDRFWYLSDPDLSPQELAWLDDTRLSDVILRNTNITELQPNVFYSVPEPTTFLLALLIATTSCLAMRGRRF